jgi:hypothetical protein
LLKKYAFPAILAVLVVAVGLLLFRHIRSAGPMTGELSPAAAQEASQKLTELTSVAGNSSLRSWEFSEKEIDSYLHYQVSSLYPKGLDGVRVQILDNAITAKAKVNFDDLQSVLSSGRVSVVSSLFKGEHQLELAGRLNAQRGTGSYEILSLRLDNNEIPKPLVDLMIKKWLLPHYPVAAPNREFALPYGIEKVQCTTGKLIVQRGNG